MILAERVGLVWIPRSTTVAGECAATGRRSIRRRPISSQSRWTTASPPSSRAHAEGRPASAEHCAAVLPHIAAYPHAITSILMISLHFPRHGYSAGKQGKN
jgi:hypothetical protein